MTVKKPEMYHIEHYLKDANTLPKEALAIVSDQDLVGYENEFAVYQKQQQQVVQEISTMSTETKERVEVIFGRTSKQYKYIERAIYNGEALADQHNELFPKPHRVREFVETAKLRCPNLGKQQSGSSRSEDSIEEMNSAVTYLINEGLSLNSEFTIGNAVEVAKARRSSQFHHSMIAEVGEQWLDNKRVDNLSNNVTNLEESKCEDTDCTGHRYNPKDNNISCGCGDMSMLLSVGVCPRTSNWGVSVTNE